LPRGHGESVLVVDDELAIRNMAQKLLSHCGFQVYTAADGGEGLAVFSQHKDQIRVVITDISMPNMQGDALIQALRRLAPKVKIIASSGLVQTRSRGDWERLGANVFLEKPYRIESLVSTLQRLLRTQNQASPEPQ
jgi:two-component system cell cycle sensor histidine kinase/response regulator CckA